MMDTVEPHEQAKIYGLEEMEFSVRSALTHPYSHQVALCLVLSRTSFWRVRLSDLKNLKKAHGNVVTLYRTRPSSAAGRRPTRVRGSKTDDGEVRS